MLLKQWWHDRKKEQLAERYIDAGVALSLAGQHRRAIEQFSEALLLNPNAARAFQQRAYSLVSEGKPTLAQDDIEQAISLNNLDAETHMVKAFIVARLGRPADARLCVETATQLDPSQCIRNGQRFDLFCQFKNWSDT